MRAIFNVLISNYLKFILWIYFFISSNGKVIQVGANNGSSNDLLNTLIKRFKLTAVLVEPLPILATDLREKYKNNPRVTIVEKIVSKDNSKAILPFFYLADKKGFDYHPFYSQFSSLDKSHLEKFKPHIKNFDKIISSTEISCITINDLVSDYNFYNVDLIQTDVEGYDLELVKSINMSLVKPAILIFESMHLDKKELAHQKKYLQSIGYRCYSYGFDTFCLNSEKIKCLDCFLRLIKVIKPNIF